MKKSLLIVAALAFGTAAIAQDAPPAGTPAGPESQAAPAPADAPTPSGSDPATTPSGAPSDVTSPSPGAANPQSGAMSGGGMSGGNMGAAQQTASATDTSNYPKCSKGMTDKCVQASSGGHKRMAHKRHK